jgi:hypothetical protein
MLLSSTLAPMRNFVKNQSVMIHCTTMLQHLDSLHTNASKLFWPHSILTPHLFAGTLTEAGCSGDQRKAKTQGMGEL